MSSIESCVPTGFRAPTGSFMTCAPAGLRVPTGSMACVPTSFRAIVAFDVEEFAHPSFGIILLPIRLVPSSNIHLVLDLVHNLDHNLVLDLFLDARTANRHPKFHWRCRGRSRGTVHQIRAPTTPKVPHPGSFRGYPPRTRRGRVPPLLVDCQARPPGCLGFAGTPLQQPSLLGELHQISSYGVPSEPRPVYSHQPRGQDYRIRVGSGDWRDTRPFGAGAGRV